MRIRINEDILRLDVSVTNTLGVNIRNRAKQLVAVKFNEQVRHHLLHFEIVLHHAVRCVLNVVHHNVEINFIRLLTVGIERLAHFDTIRVMQHFQDLQFAVLVSLVLEHLLDRHSFSSFRNRCLEYHAERSVTDDFLGIVSERLLLK